MSLVIRYDTPSIWQPSGEQTRIDNPDWKAEIKKEFPHHENTLDQLTQIRRWIKTKFTHDSNQGATIGALTVDQLYAIKVWHGCHDLAHIFTATVRLIGYPCILVETTSVVWSKAYAKNQLLENPSGHNFTEVYVNGRWILFDPMSPAHLIDYDTHEFIPLNSHMIFPIILWNRFLICLFTLMRKSLKAFMSWLKERIVGIMASEM